MVTPKTLIRSGVKWLVFRSCPGKRDVIPTMKIETELEVEFIERYVVPHKRDRLLGFASDPSKRNKMIQAFNAPGIFDKKYVTEIGGPSRCAGLLPDVYKEHGMGGRVYMISEDSNWDAQRFQMSYAVDECLAQCFDAIGYCWKSKLAFYEWHHSGASYLLNKK